MAHEFKFGIEEEMFLASARTRMIPPRSVTRFHKAASAQLKSVKQELLQNQVEICTPPSKSFSEAHETLQSLRSGLANIGRKHGILVFASGTHPTVLWPEQRETKKTRYEDMMDDLQIVGRRSVVCGLHIHVEVPRPEIRVDLMRRLFPFLPISLALSTSSPFWEKRRTGLYGYRLRAYAELPRTGLPELFDNDKDYQRYIDGMIKAGAVKDATYFWWHIRPSSRFPTLELRVADSCTHLRDTLAIAALYRCLVRLVDRRPDVNADMTGASRGFVMENLWRAERSGVHATLIDEQTFKAVSMAKVVDNLLNLIAEDAAELQCEAECQHARVIVREGTSADGQLAAFEAATETGKNVRQALSSVVDWLALETAGENADVSP